MSKFFNKRLLSTIILFVCVARCYSIDYWTKNSRKVCHHANHTYGQPVIGQRLVNSSFKYEPASWLGKKTVTVRFPPFGSMIKANISQVQVLNLYKKCDCWSEDIKITSGGIGKPYVEVNVTTGYHCENYHQFLFFNNTRPY